MTPREFEDLTLKMRTAQKNYFKSRNPEVLQLSKKLEKQVDDYLSGRDQSELFT